MIKQATIDHPIHDLIARRWSPYSLTGIAIGHYGPTPETLDESFRARADAARSRKPLSEIVFRGSWGSPAPLAQKA